MLIAWQALNKLEDRQDARFSDAFLIVTPGITIRDRLRVLLPTDPDNYYRQRDILPVGSSGAARAGEDSHHELPRVPGSRARRCRPADEVDPHERRAEPVPRDARIRSCAACAAILAGKKNIVVINDEAHHCYRRRPERAETALTGEERQEAQKRDEEARVWLSGPRSREEQDRREGHLRSVGHAVLPAGLRLSGRHAVSLGRVGLLARRRHRGGHREGPARAGRRQLDDRRTADLPRLVAPHPRGSAEEGPEDRRHRRRAEAAGGAAGRPAQPVRQLPAVVRAMAGERRRAGARPDAAGVRRRVQQHERVEDGLRLRRRLDERRWPTASEVVVPGALPLFSNEEDGRWSARPNTILVDSRSSSSRAKA